jgi:hypothetical protein
MRLLLNMELQSSRVLSLLMETQEIAGCAPVRTIFDERLGDCRNRSINGRDRLRQDPVEHARLAESSYLPNKAARSFAPCNLTSSSIRALVAAKSLATTLLRMATGLRS